MAGLRERIEKAQGKATIQVAGENAQGARIVSTWVQRAQQGASIGQPVINGKGLPVRVTGGTR